MLVDDIELELLRSIVERKETCRQAAEAIVALLARQKSRQQYDEDERMGRNI